MRTHENHPSHPCPASVRTLDSASQGAPGLAFIYPDVKVRALHCSLPTTMSVVDRLLNFDPTTWAVVGLAAAFLIHFVPYLLDSHRIREYPGPLLAKVSDIWLGYVAAQGHRSERVHELHKQYGQLSHLSLMFRPRRRRS